MIDSVPRKLPVTYPVEGRTGSALPGWKGILFGLPFIGVGAVLALGLAPRSPRGGEASQEVILSFGALFFTAGMAFVVAGARPLWRAWRRTALLARHRAEPWHADFGWDRRGIAGDAGRQARSAFYAFAGMGAFLAVFGRFAFCHVDAARAGRTVWAMRGGVLFFGLLIAAVLVNALYLLVRRLRFGRGFLHFGRFPFLLGETAELTLAPPRHARCLGQLEVTLRCVEERIQRVKRDGETTISVARWQLWADTRTIPAADLAGSGVPLVFAPPADPRLGTELSATTPRYWELSAVAKATGVDFASTFLVPVYAPPALG